MAERKGSRGAVVAAGRKASRAVGKKPDARLDRAVAFLNARASRIRTEILAIGDYLLREFFDDDPDEVSNMEPDKENSINRLAARDDLLLSYSTLWRAVHLAVQRRKIGTYSRMNKLPQNLQIELLAVEDLEQKRELAKQALEEGWTATDLKKMLGRKTPTRRFKPSGRKGRDSAAMVEMSLRHLLGDSAAKVLTRDGIAALTPGRRRRVEDLLHRLHARLSALLATPTPRAGSRPEPSRPMPRPTPPFASSPAKPPISPVPPAPVRPTRRADPPPAKPRPGLPATPRPKTPVATRKPEPSRTMPDTGPSPSRSGSLRSKRPGGHLGDPLRRLPRL